MYDLYIPSNRLFLDGVFIDQNDDNDPALQTYRAWLAQGNGPDVLPDPPDYNPPPPVTATIARIATAMEQLAIVNPTIDDLTNRIFPLAITL